MVCHYPDRSCDHTHCDAGHLFLICHVTSREHIFKGLCEFVDGSPSQQVTICPCLMVIRLVQVEI